MTRNMLKCMYQLITMILFSQCNGNAVIIKELEKELLSNYSTNVVPKSTQSERIIINAAFHLLYIVDFNEREETLTSSTWLTLKWKDPFLSWEGQARYENVSAVYLQQNQVWKPDYVLLNSAENIKLLGKSDLGVIVERDGTVLWEPGQTFRSICEVNINLYPFDSQLCKFWFGSWTYYNEIDGNVTLPEIGLNAYQENGKWEVLGSNGSSGLIAYDYFSQPTLLFKLYLRRRRTYYLLTICIPIMILSIINCLVHVLPADSGEKMSFCMTVLLSYLVFVSFLNDSLPSTSKTVSLLVMYLVLAITLSFLSVLNSVVVLYLWHKSENGDSKIFGMCSASSKAYTFNSECEKDKGDAIRAEFGSGLIKCDLKDTEIVYKYQKYARCLDRILLFVMVLLTITVTVAISMQMLLG